jgi:nicotinamidase-related amidase
MLRSNGIESLVMTGIATEVCVESTSRNAFFRDYRIVEAGDCVSWLARDRHDASQAIIARSFGMVVPSTEIAAVWDQAAAGQRNWQPEVKAANVLTTLEQRINPAHTALVLIDVQNDFCDERGAAGVRGESITMIKKVVPQIHRLLKRARAAGTMVIHVKAEYGPHVRHAGSPYRYPSTTTPEGAVWTASAADIDSGSEFLPDMVEVCLPGTWGSAFVDGIAPAGDEQVVVKHRFSGFVDTRLDLLLRSNGIRTVIVAGVTTNCCVESTVRDAVMRDYYVVIAEDCVGVKDMQSDLHDHSLETMRTYFGLVEPLDRIVGAWFGAGHLKERAIA